MHALSPMAMLRRYSNHSGTGPIGRPPGHSVPKSRPGGTALPRRSPTSKSRPPTRPPYPHSPPYPSAVHPRGHCIGAFPRIEVPCCHTPFPNAPTPVNDRCDGRRRGTQTFRPVIPHQRPQGAAPAEPKRVSHPPMAGTPSAEPLAAWGSAPPRTFGKWAFFCGTRLE